jgi:hypothetical protein
MASCVTLYRYAVTDSKFKTLRQRSVLHNSNIIIYDPIRRSRVKTLTRQVCGAVSVLTTVVSLRPEVCFLYALVVFDYRRCTVCEY